jgi:ubiquinone/menaquinone biosynthesis C-methylase UbiE
VDQLSATQLANIEFHKRLAPQYEQQPFFQTANRQRVRALLCELAKSTPAKRLLDVGCGTGLILDLAHDLFEELDGIDITPEMLGKVTPRPNVKTQIASAEATPFPGGTFDMVTAYGVLHHIEELGRLFREVRRTLKPGGVFYADESPSQHYFDALVALNPRSPMADTVRRERERVVSDPAEYQRLYEIPAEIVQRAMVQNFSRHALRQENLERLLRSAGFGTVEIRFRRFLGEDECRRDGGVEMIETIRRYLLSILPLSRPLFKYFVLVAR